MLYEVITFLDLGAKVGQKVDIAEFAISRNDTFEGFEHPLGSDTAEGTFAAGFAVGEIQEIACGLHHAAA